MQSQFNEAYSQQIINESLKNIFASPRVLLATAAMLGIIDLGYVLPKLSEIQNKVEQHLQQKTPEQVQQIETKAVQMQNSPKVQQMFFKIKDSWKNYKPLTPSAATQQNQQQSAKHNGTTNKQLSADFYTKATNMLKKDEGKRPQLYKDTKNKWTIGYGHLIKTNEEYKKYKNKTLSDEQMEQILSVDVAEKIKKAQALFPKFNQYNDEFKMVLLNGIFRGDVSGSPKTIALINAGEYKQAAKEYLNHGDYVAASKPDAKDKGVAIRMLRNAKIMAKQSNK